ncbi:MAG: AMP deaminase [Watsoniomyces obsoletus]|nr:MAG: AMP deaminase [Watsoniomyces obsoletus]
MLRRCSISTTFTRSFSNSSTHFGTSNDRLSRLHLNVPAYPYGASSTYKQSNFGLYAGRHIQFGNVITEEFRLKFRRKWKPNVHGKRLWSTSLQRWIRIKVSTRALRTIDKEGGLDEYLLGEKKARIKELGMGGWLLRWRVMQTDAVRERFREERRRLGLPERSIEGGKGLEEEDGERKLGRDGIEVSEGEWKHQIDEYDRTLDENEAAEGEENEETIDLGEEDGRKGGDEVRRNSWW